MAVPIAIRADPPFSITAHVGEVEVDQTGDGDQFADTLDTLAQHIVGHVERAADAGFLVDNLQEPIVRDDDQRIDLLLQSLETFVCNAAALGAFEGEGPGNHADGQGAGIAGQLCHDGRCAGARTAAHAGSHKHHVGPVHHAAQVVGRLDGSLFADSGSPPAPRPRELVADAQPLRGVCIQQRLGISVHHNEFHTLNACFDHPVHGIAAAAANTNHANLGEVIGEARLRVSRRFPATSHVVAPLLSYCAKSWHCGCILPPESSRSIRQQVL
ncbi:MAG: hypothetical protein R2844_07945 [Caldilineales bacterium]